MEGEGGGGGFRCKLCVGIGAKMCILGGDGGSELYIGGSEVNCVYHRSSSLWVRICVHTLSMHRW